MAADPSSNPTATMNTKVQLTIHKAEGLVALNPGGSSNPFVTATIGNQSVMTNVVNRTLNPQFDSTFTFLSCAMPTILTLRVCNKLPFVDMEDPLGTATVTLFGISPSQSKTVQLSHGGNSALAQRAPNGCGTISITYEVSEMAPEATDAAGAGNATMEQQQRVSRSSLSNSQVTPTPMSPPPANNITGESAAQAPTSSLPTNSFVPSVPTVTNPLMRSPNLSVRSNNGTSQLLTPGLTPPNLAPARVPSNLGFLVPQAAPPPPTLSTPPTMSSAGNTNVVSYPVQGLASHHGSSSQLQQASQSEGNKGPAFLPSQQPSMELFYANNDLTEKSIANAPSSAPQVPPGASPSLDAIPVAPVTQTATRFASLLDSSNPARSMDTPSQAAPLSSQFTSAPKTPSVTPQRLLVVPPNIDGTPSLNTSLRATPSVHNLGVPASRGVSAMQLPDSMTAAQAADALPSVPPPLVSVTEATTRGALPVAYAPRAQPISSSTSSSKVTTPLSTGRVATFNGVFPAAQITTSIPQPSGQPQSEFRVPVPAASSNAMTAVPFYSHAPQTATAAAGLASLSSMAPLNEVSGVPMGSAFVQRVGNGTVELQRRVMVPVTANVMTSSVHRSPVIAERPEGYPSSSAAQTNAANVSSAGMTNMQQQMSNPYSMQTGAAAMSGSGCGGGSGSPYNNTNNGRGNSGFTGKDQLLTAQEIYADAAYLFEVAANGADDAVFTKLRAADPDLTHGFTSCLDYAGRTLLHIAAWNGQASVLRTLLAPFPTTVALDPVALVAVKSGNTILHAAACGGKSEVAVWLLQLYQNSLSSLLGARNFRGMTAADCAMEAGFDHLAQVLNAYAQVYVAAPN